MLFFKKYKYLFVISLIKIQLQLSYILALSSVACMRGSHMLPVDTTVSFPLLAFLNQMAPIARFIDKFVPLLHAQQEHMSGGRYPADVAVHAKSESCV